MLRMTAAVLAICSLVSAADAVAQQTNGTMPGGTMPGGTMPGMTHGGSHGPDNAGDSMMPAMAQMEHDMSAAPHTGDADRDFAAMMIPHHQGAIDMAQFQLRHGRDPALRRMAEQIIADQEKEIALMRQWQSDHPAP